MSLTNHFAKLHNESDLNAKDSSQETLVNLLGMLFGWIMMKRLQLIDEENSSLVIWALFFVFTFFHLYCNYLAVRAVELDSFNEQRCFIVVSEYLKTSGKILNPEQVSMRESILLPVFKAKKICIGVPLLTDMVSSLQNSKELVFIKPGKHSGQPMNVFLHQDVDERSILVTYFSCVCNVLQPQRSVSDYTKSLQKDSFLDKIQENGWSLHIDSLDVGPFRYTIKSD